MNTQLNYHHLRYFLAVAGQGGIKAASRLLRVSAPTLSAQVRGLEEFLGVPLFRRERQRMELSDAGRMVKGYAERIFALGDEMLEVVMRGEPGGAEIVFVGVADSVPKLVASRLLGQAWGELPGLRIVVREGLPSELFPALAAHQLDIVLTNEAAPGAMKTQLFSRRAGRFPVGFVATAALGKRFRRRDGLAGFPVLVPTRESPLRRELERWWGETGITPEIRAEFDDTAAMYELAAAGVGAAPVFGPVMKEVAARHGLEELPLRTGLHEELFVVTADRQFQHEGPRVIARLAGEMAGRK